jgi:hypothetical protein
MTPIGNLTWWLFDDIDLGPSNFNTWHNPFTAIALNALPGKLSYVGITLRVGTGKSTRQRGVGSLRALFIRRPITI